MRFLSLGLVAVALAAVFIGCGDDETRQSGRVGVPDVVGESVREAARELAEEGLRWRYHGSREVMSGPFGTSSGGGGLDDPILSQRPSAGTEVHRSRIVVLETYCTRNPGCG